mmetsp:Transcript_25979/g.32371  ORF Transcript_25979/g.32371 Transcript_25979/m.32371 type:complete len:112 (+) Transcript_25979:49-384(+)|eukprot:CAMPEP_0170451558 /NCGR_PEP_ID=MMETSP0123-20130129/759_1 /TAXON_ID=182087 /ORGANISM="Favella ehrenbergii, Strain Fehren 1" /LENGTH=111 /DNA_ID=CAMNT_0010713289 /DNA_START=41 /DNA_END=376 /DNA_ORIENTATION=-
MTETGIFTQKRTATPRVSVNNLSDREGQLILPFLDLPKAGSKALSAMADSPRGCYMEDEATTAKTTKSASRRDLSARSGTKSHSFFALRDPMDDYVEQEAVPKRKGGPLSH